MRLALVCSFIVATAVGLSACGGASQPSTTPTPGATLRPAPATTATSTATVPAQVVGPLLVYEATASGGFFGNTTTRAIRVVDLSNGRLVSTYDYGGEDPAVTAFLTDHALAWVTQAAVRVGSQDGLKWQRDYLPPAGWHISGAAPSHSGRYIAVSAIPANIMTGQGEVAIIDTHASIEGGQQPVVVRFDHGDARLASVGDFSSITWLAGDKGVLVFGMTYNEGPAPAARLMLDGEESMTDWQAFSPDGRYEALGGGCFVLPDHELTVRDAVTGDVVFRVSDSSRAYLVQEWAPDSSAFLYTTYNLSAGDSCEDPATTWWLATPSGQNVPTSDPAAIRRDWYGPHIAELRCSGSDAVVIAPATGGHLQCPDPYRMGTVTVGGVEVGRALEVHTLGIVQP